MGMYWEDVGTTLVGTSSSYSFSRENSFQTFCGCLLEEVSLVPNREPLVLSKKPTKSCSPFQSDTR